MTAGPRPKPTAVKRLQGNPGKRRLPAEGEEAQPDVLAALGEPPEWLGEYGCAEWDRVGPVLIKNKLLTEADLAAFTAYCATLDTMIRAKQDIDREGMTIDGARGPVRNPALATFAAAVTNLRNLASEFGGTPSARSRIKLDTDDGTELDDVLRGDQDEIIE